MTAKARHLFYINRPAIETKSDFTKNCPAGGEKTIVLGCYKNGESGIYVLSVTDARLQGVEQVTAAHEMLHAAYNRLSPDDKKYVDGLLESYYRQGLKDQRIKAILQSYQTSEPGQQLNEMHSIFGTEVANLPAPLENYYKQYFSDRIKITNDAAHYQAAFTSRQATVAKDDVQLKAWQAEIKQDEASLVSQQSQLSAEQTQLSQYKSGGSIAAYNATVPDYNAKVDAYNSLVVATKQRIATYNQLVAARNTIAVEETQLEQSLSGSLAPISQ
jgi:hypothetical protein